MVIGSDNARAVYSCVQDRFYYTEAIQGRGPVASTNRRHWQSSRSRFDYNSGRVVYRTEIMN